VTLVSDGVVVVCEVQNYRTWVRQRRRGGKVAELLELQRSQERREQIWKDHVGRLRQVEHALLDVIPAQETADDQKTALVGTERLFLAVRHCA